MMGLEMGIPTVANLPLEQPLFCSGDDSIHSVAKIMMSKRKYCVLVKENDVVEGIVTTKDLAFRQGATARDVLSRTPVLTPSSMQVSAALQLMVEKKIRHLPIVAPGTDQIVGILDITKCFHQAMRRLEIMAQDSMKLNNALQDVIENEATITRQKVLQDIATLIESMETPVLESILDSELYNTTPLFASPTTTVADAIKMMSDNNSTAVLVHDSSMKSNSKSSHDCNIIGIFTSKDFVCRVLSQGVGVDPSKFTLTRVMTTRPNFAFKSLGIHSALRMMYEGHFLNLPVIDDTGNILGLISVLQLTHAALSSQLATRSRISGSQSTIDEPYLKISSVESPSESMEVGKDSDFNERATVFSLDNEIPNLSMNYFWKSFDVSDNESASSSQLSLVDLSQTVNNFNAGKGVQEHFSGRRSSTLLQKKFFENGKPSKCRLKVTVLKEDGKNHQYVLGSMKFKTASAPNPESNTLKEIVEKAKDTFDIGIESQSAYSVKYMNVEVTNNEKLYEIYNEFICVNGSRHYMPLLCIANQKKTGLLYKTRQLFATAITPISAIFQTQFQIQSWKIYMQACIVFFTGIMVGKVLK